MVEVSMPRLSDTMTEGVIGAWLKHEGDQVARGEVIAEIETDKATMELEAYESGVLTAIIAHEGDTVPIGQPIAMIGEPGEPGEPGVSPVTEPPAAAPPAADAAHLRATPLVRRLAREHGIDLSTVTGTGPDGRIVRADIEELIAEPAAAPAAGVLVSTRPAAPGADDERVELGSIRRITARRLTESAAAPHFYLTSVADVDALQRLRAELTADGVTVGVTDLLIRACAITLDAHPGLNSSWGGDHLVRHRRINIGCAVDTDAGLVVPVLRDANRLGVTEIAGRSRELIGRARAGRLAADELTGGTFTISNLGMFGVQEFTAIINPPEAAILAVGAARAQPVVRDGALSVGSTCALTLGVDHRVVDGAGAARFLQDLVAVLEHPLRLLV